MCLRLFFKHSPRCERFNPHFTSRDARISIRDTTSHSPYRTRFVPSPVAFNAHYLFPNSVPWQYTSPCKPVTTLCNQHSQHPGMSRCHPGARLAETCQRNQPHDPCTPPVVSLMPRCIALRTSCKDPAARSRLGNDVRGERALDPRMAACCIVHDVEQSYNGCFVAVCVWRANASRQ